MYISLRYRPNKWPFWVLVGFEFPLTVAVLALFGIAAPNLYRTKLWADGAMNGFNSSPMAGLYAAANYRSYTSPKVWGQFITNFNLVISVFSMFLLLTKSAMYILHVFPPLLSVLTHAAVVALYAVSVAYQAGSDMSDPRRPQPGVPWYISKSCSVTYDKNLIGYCRQAKAAFACTIVILFIFAAQLGLAIFSCFPSRNHRAERESKRLARESRYAHLESPSDSTFESKGPTAMSLTEIANAPPAPVNNSIFGPHNPMTPRTLAFNRLGGTKDLPLRHNLPPNVNIPSSSAGAAPSAPKSPNFSTRFALRSPTFPGSPLSPGFDNAERKVDEEMGRNAGAAASASIYFPPPPKVSVKSGKRV